MSFHLRHHPWLWLAAVVASVQLAGCANTLVPTRGSGFGDAVRTAKQVQTLNPQAALNPDPVLGLDGVSAVNAINRYECPSPAAAPSGVTINMDASSVK